MGFEAKLNYRHWLKTSFEWETVRMLALIKADYHCFICRTRNESNDVHHLIYRTDGWKRTQQHDVRVLCRECHKRIHELVPMQSAPSPQLHKKHMKPFWNAVYLIKKERGLLPTNKQTQPQPITSPRRLRLLQNPDLCRVCVADKWSSEVSFIVKDIEKRLRLCAACESLYVKYGHSPKFFSACRERKRKESIA